MELEIDHIIPVSKGEATVRTICGFLVEHVIYTKAVKHTLLTLSLVITSRYSIQDIRSGDGILHGA